MAKITAYKFVNPGLSAKSSPAVKAANQTTLAVNRLGVTVESIAKTITDLGTVSAFKSKLELKQEIFDRRQKRLEKDAEAENQKEKVDKSQVKKDEKSILTYGKQVGKGFFGILEDLLSPLASILSSFGAFAITSNVLKYFADEENREKIVTFLEKTEFVFKKLSELAGGITQTFQKGIDFVFGKETTLEQRLNALGKIAMAIGGIAGMIAAAGGIRDLLDPGEDIDGGRRTPKGSTPDGKPVKPPKPTPTNPSGADPDVEGPRKRPKVSTIADQFGDAASKQYKKILAEYGDDAARAYANALKNSGGDASKALKAWKRLKLPLLPKPKPNALQRLGGFVQGVTEGAKGLAKTGLSIAGRGLNKLGKGALEQFNRLSNAGKTAWNNTIAGTQALQDKATKWATIQADNFKQGAAALGERAKNALFQKVLEPLRPIIDPIAKKAKEVGELIFENLKKIPGFEKVLKFLKQKGIDGLGAVATAGKKLGQRAGTIIPVVGGLVNLAFAYDRAANGDSIGALLEGTSGILDIAGLFTGGTTSGVSMLIDGYMFARDFIPQLQEGENAVINRLGVGGFKSQIDEVLSKLPNIGEIINTLTGRGNDTGETGDAPPQKAAGGVVSGSHPDTGSGYTVEGVKDEQGRPAVFSRGGATAFGKMVQDSNGIVKGSDIASSKRSVSKNAAVGGVPNSNHLYGNALDIHGGSQTWMRSHGRKYGWIVQDYAGSHGGHFNYHGPGSSLPADNAGGSYSRSGGGGGGGSASVSSPFDPKAFIAFFKMIGVKEPVASEKEDETGKGNPPMKSVPVNTELTTGNLSEQHAIAQSMKMIPIPVVITSLVGMPTPVQINKSSGNVPGASSSLSKRMS